MRHEGQSEVRNAFFSNLEPRRVQRNRIGCKYSTRELRKPLASTHTNVIAANRRDLSLLLPSPPPNLTDFVGFVEFVDRRTSRDAIGVFMRWLGVSESPGGEIATQLEIVYSHRSFGSFKAWNRRNRKTYWRRRILGLTNAKHRHGRREVERWAYRGGEVEKAVKDNDYGWNDHTSQAVSASASTRFGSWDWNWETRDWERWDWDAGLGDAGSSSWQASTFAVAGIIFIFKT
ncbi:hypothetical protein SCHPADRAFT_889677 [Schizopora paradoxa]|uniref:Uncharacterized protein n=1 Tax=Schizopora paradoxa TaxID=27342 RepID=A0A0H2SAI5_9AGAM|nr:hypothetical protein SCHPADRAFT_889677 [Schizopora paradoxa]